MFFFRGWTLVFITCAATFVHTAYPTRLSGPGSDLRHAPPAFTHLGGKAVFVDFSYVDLSYRIDAAKQKIAATAKIEFFARDAGFPVFDLVPTPTAISLNGRKLSGTGSAVVATPDQKTRVRVVAEPVDSISHNLLEVDYELPSSSVTFASGGVRILWSMSDVGNDRAFLEQFSPSNLEFDHFQMNFTIELSGSSSPHRLYTNGTTKASGPENWAVEFPAHFTTSSFYFHLTNSNFAESRFAYQGLEKEIPITIYGASASSVQSALAVAKRVMAELETDYGPYAHASFIAYINSSGGGMEHCGSTITSVGALDHELMHSWFARGVMPASGNAGWIDESIASWRDNNYPSSWISLSGSSVNLANLGPYNRLTPMAAYSSGMRLVSGFDALFSRGMKKHLRELFSSYKYQSLSSDGYRLFLERVSGKNLEPYFSKYVYGKTRAEVLQHTSHHGSKHPPALSRDEILRLR